LHEVGQMGYGGMVAATKYGGAELSRKNISAIVEGLASECVSTTAYITIHNGALAMIDKFASPELRAQYVPSLARMEALVSFCLTEPGSGSDAASISTTGTKDPLTNEYVITGNKCFISGAGSSDVLLVMFRTSTTSLSCAIVPRDTPGITFGANENKMGWKTQPTRQVHFDQVRVPTANLVGQEGQGFKIAMVGLDGARLSIAACSLGAAADSLQRALLFVKEVSRVSTIVPYDICTI
jgi:alkylation response protein AidB-like acyl-CoA dehydrogenase